MSDDAEFFAAPDLEAAPLYLLVRGGGTSWDASTSWIYQWILAGKDVSDGATGTDGAEAVRPPADALQM